MKVTKFVPLFTTVVVVGFGVFVLVGDVSAGGTGTCMRKVNGVWIAEPCVSGGGGGSGSGGGYTAPRRPYTPPRPSPQEKARQERRNAAKKANKLGVKYHDQAFEYIEMGDYETALQYVDAAIEKFEEALRIIPEYKMARKNLSKTKGKKANIIGITYWEREDFEAAARYYREALRYLPDDEVIQANLRDAEEYLAEKRSEREAERKRQAEEAARKAAERERQRQLAKAKTEITGMLDDLSAELGASKTSIYSQAESKDSLGFIGSDKPLSSEGAKTSSLQGLRFISEQEEKGKRDAKKLKFEPLNKPEDPLLKDAGAQLKSTLKSGEKAKDVATKKKKGSKEKMHGDAQRGFDTPGEEAGSLTRLPEDLGQNPWKAPVVTDADRKRIPKIRDIEQERDVVRKKRVELETKLEKLRSEKPKDWTVKEVEIKQKISVTEKLEQFHNYALGRLLQKNKKQTEAQAKTDK